MGRDRGRRGGGDGLDPDFPSIIRESRDRGNNRGGTATTQVDRFKFASAEVLFSRRVSSPRNNGRRRDEAGGARLNISPCRAPRSDEIR